MSRLKESRKHLSYANVTATLALVVAVAGIPTAVAVTSKPGKNTVTSKSIKRGNVTARDLADVRVVTTDVSGPTLAVDVRATCGPNEKLIGGGGQIRARPGASDSPGLRVSQPDGNNGWVISSNTGGGNGTAYALCLSAKATKKGN